ncbi:MAG TPA: chromate transporter [Chloroflexia bacterium]|nr:chromate transporter [Chloroflexia bacterium]
MNGPALDDPVQLHTTPTYSLWQLASYFLKLGTLGFGGPVALVGYMRRDLVEKRGWITEADYKEGLALAQLAPGPLAAQLGIYLGYVHYRVLGATVAGLAFIMPSFVMVVGLALAYTSFGGLSWMQAVFYGVSASVIGIIAFSAYKLTNKTLGRNRLLWAIFLVSVIITVLTESEQVFLFLAAGILVWLVKAPPRYWRVKPKNTNLSAFSLLALVTDSVPAVSSGAGLLWDIFVYFAQAGAFVFGSGLAIVPFLYGGLVNDNHWLTNQQFVDSVAVAMITPGPVVITTGFIGFLVASFPGACVAALATFLPCYLITVIAAPYFHKYGKLPGIKAFVNGVTAAATGAITGSVIVLGRRTLVDIPTGLLAIITLGVLWRFKKVPEPLIVLGAALVGLAIYPLVRP